MKEHFKRSALQRLTAFLFFTLVSLATSACSSLFYQPDRFLYLDPVKIGFPYQEIKFLASDQTELVGWFFKSKNEPRGTIALFHGNAQNLSSHFASLIWATESHYNLFVFSYRGYGGSHGDPDQSGTILDGLAALQKARELKDQNGGGKFIVIGQSLGGAIAMRSISEWDQKSSIQGLVLDSTFTSYPRVARRMLAQYWLLWPFSPIAHLLVSNSKGTEQAVRDNRIPLLVIHDLRDPVVAFKNGRELFELAQEPKTFWELNRGEHVGVFSNPKGPERQRFLDWIESLPK